MRRLSVLLVLVCVLATIFLVPGASAASADPNAEGVFINGVNRARSSAGVGQLRITGDLVEIARRHSAEMAAKGQLYHNGNLGNEVSGWQAIAENVGDGTSPEYVHNLFMQSAAHRQNIVDPRFTDMGIGVVWSGNRLYVTEVFRQPDGSSQSAPPPAAPPTTAAPAPPPAPAPAPAPAKAPAPRVAPAKPAPPAPAPAPAPAVAAVAVTPKPKPKARPTPAGDVVAVSAVDHSDGQRLALQAILASHAAPTPHRRAPVLVLVALMLQLGVGVVAGAMLLARFTAPRIEALLPSRLA